MPFTFRIRQTGIFRTKLEIDDLCAGIYKAGMQDRFRRFLALIPSEGYMIIYDPEHIGTGLRVLWDPEDTDEITLKLPAVTTIHDIDMTMNIMMNIMKKWNSWNVKFEDVRYTKKDLDGLKNLIMERTNEILGGISALYDDNIALVHGAMWPLMFDAAKLRQFGISHDAEGFSRLLHECQNRDLTWCACHVYLSDDQKSYQGVYTLPCGMPLIIPVRPMPPVDMIDPATGDSIVCSKYIAKVIANPDHRPLVQMEYHKFLSLINASKMPLYDACHVACQISEEDILQEMERREEMEGKPCW